MGGMSTAWGIALVTLVIVLLAAAVIVMLALSRHSRDQWKSRVRRASAEVLHGGPSPEVPVEARPRRVAFDELWAAESKPGSAYWTLPQILPDPDRKSEGEPGAGSTGAQTKPEADPKPESDANPQIARRSSLAGRVPSLKPVEGFAPQAPRLTLPADGRHIA